MSVSLTPDEARKLVLHSQQLPPGTAKAPALQATHQALEHLGYIQIDTISVVARAHHHTLWNRNPRYQNEHLDQLLAQKQAFEYWSHAAAYLPMRDYRFSLPRKLAFKSGEQAHWYERDEKLMRHVLERIRAEGPLMAKDFADTGTKTGAWRSKPAKRALEYLFMQGDLMTPYRQNFHKVYDLTERVLPADIDTTPPTLEAYARFLIVRFLEAHGLALEPDFSYLLKGPVKKTIKQQLAQMLSDGELQQIQVAESHYYALPSALTLLNKPLTRHKAKILSPFDNLLIQRQRMRHLFNFDYQLECYIPAAKREYGYFCLPVLWDGCLVARLDCKAERKRNTLVMHALHLEPGLRRIEDFYVALQEALQAFATFNRCEAIESQGIL